MMSNESDGGSSRAANLAVLAAKTARIAKAASVGGLYGAAAETVKSFLPQILKLIAIILIVVLLLPTIIFTSVPHYLFGWIDNDSVDVLRMTELAKSITEYYETKFSDLLDQAVANVKERFLSKIPLPDFIVGTDVKLGSTNQTWIIAIIAVHHEQDLEIINESVILQMIEKTLKVSSFFRAPRLILSITDILPNALMTLLGFSDEQREWAKLLVSTMNEEQNIDSSDSDYSGSSGIDYGNITYTEGATEVVYYNQADARWGDVPYGQSGTIGTSGCGPTALAIVVSSLTGRAVTPVETAEWSVRNGYRVEGNGSMHALIPNGARHYGLTVEGAGWRDGQKIVDALANGKLVVAIMSKGHFTSRGHFIVLRGVTADGKILVADPISVSRSEQLWDLEIILNEANRNAGAGGPFWIVSK